MPLTRPTFFSSSVLKINSSLGYGSQGSTLEATLVDDPTNGDSFTPGTVGGPVYFSIGAYSFNGILRKYTVDRNVNGYPVYTVQVSDPRHLLEATKVIIADYRLSVTGIYNLFNVFGYWENTGFGNAQVNDSGMPWELVRDGITSICNGSAGPWGGPITYRGTAYSIDLSDLPDLPEYFRVAGKGHGLSILEFIQICCDAANYDFFFKLVSTTITLVTVARANAYPLGTISTILNTVFAGTVVRSSVGIEERDETTSVFMIGGNVQQLIKVAPSGAFPFWGFDGAGNIMYGGLDKHAVFYAKNPATQADGYSIYSYPVKTYALYVPEIAAITGSTLWTTNDLELQILLGLGNSKDSYASWVEYLRKADPDMFLQIHLTNQSFQIQPNFRAPEAPNNALNTIPARLLEIQAAGRGAIADTGEMRLKLVFEALFKYAKDYYGKKYALYIPGVARYVDGETGAIFVSDEPSDGGYLNAVDTNDLLGLPSYASDLFQTQDGRYIPYVKYNSYRADLSRVNPANSLIDGNNLFVKAKLNNQIYFDGDLPFAVIDVDPVYDYPDAVVGISGVVGALIKATGINFESSPGTITLTGANTLNNMIKGQIQGSVPIVTHAAARMPSGYEIPLKSNVLTYGPWYAQGATGKVNYEQDNSLVPWNYGGYTGLDNAGVAKSLYGISQAQVIEAGYIEVVGPPAYNLGDIIVASGTNITNISVGWGAQGVTTTYRFETYVPRFGQLAKYNIDRLQRLSVIGTKKMAEVKALNRQQNVTALANFEALNTLNLMATMPENINIRTPQNALVGTVLQGSGFSHPIVSTTTFKEAIGLIPPSGVDYNNTVFGTWESVFGPYQIKNLSNSTGALLPKLVTPSGIWNSTGMTSFTLNPFYTSPSGWTIRYYSKGEGGYEDVNDNNLIGQNQSNKVKRSFASKSPLILVGWGYDKYGNVTPSGTDFLLNYSTHKAGPIDPLWDEDKGVWSVHDIKNVRVDDSIVVGGSGLVTVLVNETDTYSFYAFNFSDSEVATGTSTQIGYIADENKWAILASASNPLGPQLRVTDGIVFGDNTYDANLLIIDPATKDRTEDELIWALDLSPSESLPAFSDYICHYVGSGAGGFYYVSTSGANQNNELDNVEYWRPLYDLNVDVFDYNTIWGQYQPNTIVSYSGILWQANAYTQYLIGEPGVSDDWDSIPAWSAGSYLEGDVVDYSGEAYEATVNTSEEPTTGIDWAILDSADWNFQQNNSLTYLVETSGLYLALEDTTEYPETGLTWLFLPSGVYDVGIYEPSGIYEVGQAVRIGRKIYDIDTAFLAGSSGIYSVNGEYGPHINILSQGNTVAITEPFNNNINLESRLLVRGWNLDIDDFIDRDFVTNRLNFEIRTSGFLYDGTPTSSVQISGTLLESTAIFTHGYVYYPLASPQVSEGVVSNGGQNIGGPKFFTNFIGIGGSGMDASGLLTYPDGDVLWVIAATPPQMIPTNSKLLFGSTLSPAPFELEQHYSTYSSGIYDGTSFATNATLYGELYQWSLGFPRPELPAFAINIDRTAPFGGPPGGVGLYSWDFDNGGFKTLYGVRTVGGIVFDGDYSIPLSAFPSGNDLASLFPPGIAPLDYKFKNSSNDTTAEYSSDKIVAGSGIFIQTLDEAGNERLEINADIGNLASNMFSALSEVLGLYSGYYSPTITNGTNVTSSTLLIASNYLSVGHVVTVSGSISITTTSSNTFTDLFLTIPIGSNVVECGGTCAPLSEYGTCGAVTHFSGFPNEVQLAFYCGSAGAITLSFTFTYRYT